MRVKITLPISLSRRALKEAKRLGMTFGQYVSFLVLRDYERATGKEAAHAATR